MNFRTYVIFLKFCVFYILYEKYKKINTLMNNRTKIKLYKNKTFFKILEIFYYLTHLNNLFLQFNSYKTFFYFKIFSYFKTFIKIPKQNLFIKFIKFNKFQIKKHFERISHFTNHFSKLSQSPVYSININKNNKQRSFIFLFFNMTFLVNFYNINKLNTFHAQYKLFFNVQSSFNLYLNNNKFFFYWYKAFLFLWNIFYFNLNFLIFSSKIFKQETLSFNWTNLKTNIDLWQYSYSFFIFKINNFNNKIDFLFLKLKKFNIRTVFVSDCFYHYKNLYYFKKHKIFSICPTPANFNPWLVSYPIPILINNYFLQFLFFKLLLICYKYSLNSKYELHKNLWNSLILENNNKKKF